MSARAAAHLDQLENRDLTLLRNAENEFCALCRQSHLRVVVVQGLNANAQGAGRWRVGRPLRWDVRAGDHREQTQDWSARYQEAETDFKRAIALAGARGGAKTTPVLLGNLGLVYEARGRYGEAISQCRLAREEHIRRGDEWNAAACLGNVGNVQSMRSQFPEAEGSYKEALGGAFVRLGDDVYAANTAVNLAGVCRVLGRHNEALLHLEGALAAVCRERLALTEAAALVADQGTPPQFVRNRYGVPVIRRRAGRRRSARSPRRAGHRQWRSIPLRCRARWRRTGCAPSRLRHVGKRVRRSSLAVE